MAQDRFKSDTASQYVHLLFFFLNYVSVNHSLLFVLLGFSNDGDCVCVAPYSLSITTLDVRLFRNRCALFALLEARIIG